MDRAAVTVATGPTASGIAYQVGGGGYPDLLLVPDGLLPMVALRELAHYVRFLAQLGRLGRLVLFDRRGIGASIRAGRTGPWGLAEWADDAAEVLTAVGSARAVVVGLAEGAMTAVVLAARHPEAVAALVLVNATPGPGCGGLARRGEGPRYIEYLRSNLHRGWLADPPGLEVIAPSLGRDPAFSAWLTAAFRRAGDARKFLPTFDLALRSDVRGDLGMVRCPTLVVHRRGDAWFAADHGRVLAGAISQARYVELPGADHAPYVGATQDLFHTVRWFLAEIFPSLVPTNTGDLTGDDLRLTARQAQILGMVRAGLSDREVAARMGISHRTVQKHLELAYRRLGVRNRTAAALMAAAAGSARPAQGTVPAPPRRGPESRALLDGPGPKHY